MTVRSPDGPRILTGPQVADVAHAAGFRGGVLVTAIAIAYAETGGTLDAHTVGDVDLKVIGEQSTGLWQVNFRPLRDSDEIKRDPTRNFDPGFNARAAYAISHGGTDFGPWSTFDPSPKHRNNNGAYRKYLAKARQAVAGMSGAPIPEVINGITVAPALLDGPVAPLDGTVESLILSGTVDLTTDLASELTLTILDPDFAITWAKKVSRGVRFTHVGITWQVTSHTVEPSPSADPQVTVHASPAGSVFLRSNSPTPVTGLSPTDYVKAMATQAGLGFVGQTTAAQPNLGPALVPDTGPDAAPGTQKSETAWDVATRLAREQAKTDAWLAFEAGGTFCFGQPAVLGNHFRDVVLSCRGFIVAGADNLEVYGIPSCEETQSPSPGSPASRRVRASVARPAAEGLRPGQRAHLVGIPGFDDIYMISRVSWPLTNGLGPQPPATVELVQFPSGVLQIIPATGGVPGAGLAPGDPFRSPRISEPERISIFGPPGDRPRTTTYRVPWDSVKVGRDVIVNRLIAKQFAKACQRAKESSTWEPRRIDSYNPRKIPGSSNWSLHSFGLAWDFFSSPPGVAPPGGVTSPQSAPDAAFRAAFRAEGFYLGADFKHTGGFGAGGDYPHIEWASGMPPPTHDAADQFGL